MNNFTLFQTVLSTGLDVYFRPPSKSFQLSWNYLKQQDISNDTTVCDRALISSISISGVASGVGGSPSCQTCPPGTSSNAPKSSVCQPCDAGMTSLSGSTSCEACPAGTFSDRPAFPCLNCGNSTVPNIDSTECEYNCNQIQVVGSAHNYSLEAIQSWIFNFGPTGTNNEQQATLQGTFCGYNPFCIDAHSVPLHTYACNDSNTLLPIELAKTISFLDEKDGKGFTTLLQNELLGCATVIRMVCDPMAGNGAPAYDSSMYPTNYQNSYYQYFLDTCKVFLTWRSVYGCALCQSSDFGYYDSDCIGGSAVRTFYQKSNCNGGETLPPKMTIACVENVILTKGAIAGIIISVLILIIAASAVGVHFWWKHKKLYSQYSQLKNTHLPMDENDLTLTTEIDDSSTTENSSANLTTN